MLSRVIFAIVAALLLVCVASGSDVDDLKTQVAALAEQVAALTKKVSLIKEDSFKEDIDESAVVVLTGDNFDATVTNTKLTLVEFYAPWCGHCKALAPEYAKAAMALADNEDATLAKIDCTGDANKEVCSKYGVKGYPTIKLFNKDGSEPVDFEEARKADAIVSYMNKMSLPAVTVLETEADVKTFQEDADVKVFAVFTSDEDLAAFTVVANALRNDFSFAALKGTEAKVIVIKSFEDDAVFSGSFSDATFSDDLQAFIRAEAFPPVGDIGPKNYGQYLARGFNFVWVFYDAENQKDFIDNHVVPVATEHKSALSFVKLDGKQWASHAENMGVKKTTPGIVLEDRNGSKRNFIFPEDQEITKDSLAKWVADFLSGELKPHIKSDEIPEKNDEPVTVLVGKNFEEVAFADDKDVLVEFYAPWCGHCKALAPEYETLGTKYADDDKVVIAKVDSTTNDTPEPVEGFPTLIFYPAGAGKTGIPYEGARTAEGLAEFIEANKKASGADKKEL